MKLRKHCTMCEITPEAKNRIDAFTIELTTAFREACLTALKKFERKQKVSDSCL